MTAVVIRPEAESDVAAIRALTQEAFADVPQSRQTEAAVVDGLRAAGALTLSLVAVDDSGEIVGHVAVSPISIGGDVGSGWFGGGPLSVRPGCQRAGIGTALTRAAFERLRDMGARGCVVVGDPAYYRRFGFHSDPCLVVEGVPPENVLVLALDEQIPEGAVSFDPAFDAEAPPAPGN